LPQLSAHLQWHQQQCQAGTKEVSWYNPPTAGKFCMKRIVDVELLMQVVKGIKSHSYAHQTEKRKYR